MTERPITAPALVALAILASGCGDPADDASSSAGASAGIVDSAGVTWVRFDDLARSTVPTLDARQEFITSDAGVDLFRPVAARLLPDGGVVIANAGTHEILRMAADGSLAHRFGREGDGPGEFRGLSALFVTDSATIVAYDARRARLAEFGLDGTLLGARALEPASRVVDLQPLTLLDGGGAVAVLGEIRVFGRSGVGRDSTPLLRFDASGIRPDTIGWWKVTEYSYTTTDQGSTRREVGFGRDAAWAGRNGRTVIGSTDSLDLTILDDGVVVGRIVSGGALEPVSADALSHRDAELARISERLPDGFRQATLDTPARETYPAFDALAMDDEGRVWIGLYPVPGHPTRRWLIVAPDGTVPGAVELPADARILDAAGGRIAVLLRSELDEEFVAVMRVDGL